MRVHHVEEVDVLLLLVVGQTQRHDGVAFGSEDVDRDGVLSFKFGDLWKRHGELDPAQIQYR